MEKTKTNIAVAPSAPAACPGLSFPDIMHVPLPSGMTLAVYEKIDDVTEWDPDGGALYEWKGVTLPFTGASFPAVDEGKCFSWREVCEMALRGYAEMAAISILHRVEARDRERGAA